MKNEVEPLRRAARQVVRELHLLDGKFCIEGFTYSECHLLAELETLGQAAASELGERLALEKSTMSRLVNSLLGRGYLLSSRNPADGRQRMLSLNDKGRNGLKRINTWSNQQVELTLDYIPPGERQCVVEGVARYARALHHARIGREYRIRPIRQKDNPVVAGIIRQVMTEFGAVGCGYSIEDSEVDAMYQAYPPPHSAFFVVERQGKVLGCGGMGPLAGGALGVCELRKMYFVQELRGTGLGTRLLGMILDAAHDAGYSLCYLETLEKMSSARQLYSKRGFKPIQHSLGNTGHSSCNQFMTLEL